MIPLNEQAGAAVHGSRTEDVPRWTRAAVEALFELPFNDLLHRAQTVHRLHFDANAVQLSTLLSIKTGGCPEDCAYCPQSARYHTGVENEPLVPLEAVLAAARAAKQSGATRFCMGAAWRGPKQKDLEQVAERVSAVKALGLETCATLGLLREGQAEELKAAGLDYYNHNLDTAPEFYGEIITTRTYGDRLDTLARVRRAGIKVCCGGIVGMGESRAQRAGLIAGLASLAPQPESVPINELVQVEGTPLDGAPKLDRSEFDFLRRQAPHHRQSRSRARSRPAGKARASPCLNRGHSAAETFAVVRCLPLLRPCHDVVGSGLEILVGQQ